MAQSKPFAGTRIQPMGNGIQLTLDIARQVRAIGQILPQQPVGVLIGPALPPAVGIGEADLERKALGQACMLGHLFSAIIGQRFAQQRRHLPKCLREYLAALLASVPAIPAFYLAEQVGSSGEVLAIDVSAGQVARARAIQGSQLPWLRFACADMRALPPDLPTFDRVTGNLSIMFFRPNRFEAVRGLVKQLAPGGQLVLTFSSYGTFNSLWQLVDQAMAHRD